MDDRCRSRVRPPFGGMIVLTQWGQLKLLSCAGPPARSKTKLYCSAMFRTGMCFSVTSGRLPSVRPTAKQTHETLIDLRRREPMEMTVIPVQPLRHVPRDVVGVGVRHPRRDVQHDIVRISLRADVRAMGVEIYR